MKSLKKNVSYQTAYQVLNTCLPLITAPYLSRVLTAKYIGVFSYTQSIVNYFTIIAMLGVINYGTRTIASNIDDKKKYSKDFWSIYLFQFIVSAVLAVMYLLYVIFICKENRLVALLQGIYILGALCDISWLYFGLEAFEITVKISMVVRVISVASILIFVKNPSDVWIYTLIMSTTVFSTNFLLWFKLRRVVDISELKNITVYDIKRHIKPNLLLFVPRIAISVYHIMDKTMLGALTTFNQSGYYANSDKLINIPLGIIAGIGTIMLSRTTVLIETGRDKEADKLFLTSTNFIVCVSVAMAFGIAAVSNEFVPLFFGNDFLPCIELTMIFSPVLVIKGLSEISRMQYLIPHHMENVYMQSTVIGAVVNFTSNIFLIKRYGAIGAVIGTMLAELSTCVWQYYNIRKNIDLKKIGKEMCYYIMVGMIMFFGVRYSSRMFSNNFISVVFEVFIGAMIYSVLCLVHWKNSKIINLKNILKNKGDVQ